MHVIHKILVANRGEIAVRVISTARKLGIKTVAVYSEIDADSMHVSYADEAYCIGEVELSDTYLNIGKIVEVATRSQCNAVHPGYGFLAENPDFSAACEQAGIIFIGPPPQVIRDLANKVVARNIMEKAGIPFIPGTSDIPKGGSGVNEAFAFARACGYPVMLKASCGGGGRGIR